MFEPRAGPRPLASLKCGKMELAGGTITPDKRKGELALIQSEDGLMHVAWTDSASGSKDVDLIVFPEEVSLKRVTQCKDAYAMVLSWSTSSRKLFFWSQELRKKGAAPDDCAAEDALIAKFNATVNNPPPPGGGGGGGGDGGTIGGLSQSNYNDLMAMLQRNAGAARAEPPTPTPQPPAPAPSATPSVMPAAATPAAPAPSRAPPPADASAAPGAPITSEGLQAILRGVMQHSRTAQQDGSLLPELFAREELLQVVRNNYAEFTALLRPHLAPTEPADSVEETLSSPQLRQAVGQLAAALNSQNAEQIFAELNLRPQSAGVLGFIEAVQQQADATGAAAPASDNMDTS